MCRGGAAGVWLCHDRRKEQPDHHGDQRPRCRERQHSGTTPITVTLKKGRGYFKPEVYTVRFTKDGFQPREIQVRGAVNGWYFGNIIFGGLIGLLAVDPATGAMYTLKPDAVEGALSALKVSRTAEGRSLTVVLLANVPQAQREQLISISAN